MAAQGLSACGLSVGLGAKEGLWKKPAEKSRVVPTCGLQPLSWVIIDLLALCPFELAHHVRSNEPRPRTFVSSNAHTCLVALCLPIRLTAASGFCHSLPGLNNLHLTSYLLSCTSQPRQSTSWPSRSGVGATRKALPFLNLPSRSPVALSGLLKSNPKLRKPGSASLLGLPWTMYPNVYTARELPCSTALSNVPDASIACHIDDWQAWVSIRWCTFLGMQAAFA